MTQLNFKWFQHQHQSQRPCGQDKRLRCMGQRLRRRGRGPPILSPTRAELDPGLASAKAAAVGRMVPAPRSLRTANWVIFWANVAIDCANAASLAWHSWACASSMDSGIMAPWLNSVSGVSARSMLAGSFCYRAFVFRTQVQIEGRRSKNKTPFIGRNTGENRRCSKWRKNQRSKIPKSKFLRGRPHCGYPNDQNVDLLGMWLPLCRQSKNNDPVPETSWQHP